MPGPIFRNPNSSPPPRRAKLARFEKTYYPEMKISDSEPDEYVSTRHSGESSQKRGLKRQASSMDTLSPKPKRIKREEELPEIRRSPSVFFVETLENGASAFTKVSRVYGLTEEGTFYPLPDEFRLTKTRYVYRPYAEQIAENSHSRFPLRALNDSKHVIEVLADPNDRRYCSPGLELLELEMTPATQDNFRDLFPRKSKGIIEKNIAKTQKHIQNLINRRSVSPPRYKQETLTRNKLLASDLKLENQQGVIATEDITGDGIQNLGFYQGSLAETPEEKAKQRQQHGNRIIHYLRDVFWTDVNNQKHEGQINPLGEGGVMHLVNTSLKPTLWSDAFSNWRGYLTTDWDRINVMCVEYTGLFQKKNGDRIRLPLTAYTVIPGKTILKGQEFRAGYGPLFEIRLNNELGLEKPIAVKQEPLSDTETIAEPSNPFKTVLKERTAPSLSNTSSESEDEIPLSRILHQSSAKKKPILPKTYFNKDYSSSPFSSDDEDAFSETIPRGRNTQITPLQNKGKVPEIKLKQLNAEQLALTETYKQKQQEQGTAAADQFLYPLSNASFVKGVTVRKWISLAKPKEERQKRNHSPRSRQAGREAFDRKVRESNYIAATKESYLLPDGSTVQGGTIHQWRLKKPVNKISKSAFPPVNVQEDGFRQLQARAKQITYAEALKEKFTLLDGSERSGQTLAKWKRQKERG